MSRWDERQMGAPPVVTVGELIWIVFNQDRLVDWGRGRAARRYSMMPDDEKRRWEALGKKVQSRMSEEQWRVMTR